MSCPLRKLFSRPWCTYVYIHESTKGTWKLQHKKKLNSTTLPAGSLMVYACEVKNERSWDFPPGFTAQLGCLYTFNMFSINARALRKYKLLRFFNANSCLVINVIYIYKSNRTPGLNFNLGSLTLHCLISLWYFSFLLWISPTAGAVRIRALATELEPLVQNDLFWTIFALISWKLTSVLSDISFRGLKQHDWIPST